MVTPTIQAYNLLRSGAVDPRTISNRTGLMPYQIAYIHHRHRLAVLLRCTYPFSWLFRAPEAGPPPLVPTLATLAATSLQADLYLQVEVIVSETKARQALASAECGRAPSPVPAQPGNQWRLKQRAPAQQPASTPPTLQQPHQHHQQQQSESSPGSQPQPNVVPEGAAACGSTLSTSHGGPLSTHAQTLPVPRASMLPEDSRDPQAGSPEVPPQSPAAPSLAAQPGVSVHASHPGSGGAAAQHAVPPSHPRELLRLAALYALSTTPTRHPSSSHTPSDPGHPTSPTHAPSNDPIPPGGGGGAHLVARPTSGGSPTMSCWSKPRHDSSLDDSLLVDSSTAPQPPSPPVVTPASSSLHQLLNLANSPTSTAALQRTPSRSSSQLPVPTSPPPLPSASAQNSTTNANENAGSATLGTHAAARPPPGGGNRRVVAAPSVRETPAGFHRSLDLPREPGPLGNARHTRRSLPSCGYGCQHAG